jgi:hypothetical protein
MNTQLQFTEQHAKIIAECLNCDVDELKESSLEDILVAFALLINALVTRVP